MKIQCWLREDLQGAVVLKMMKISIQDSMSLEKRIMSDSGQSDEDSMLAAKRRRINSSEDSMMGGIKYKKAKKIERNKQF